MSSHELGTLCIFLFATLVLAQVLGELFVRIRQPRVIGEILAGVAMGPAIVGRLWHPSLPGSAGSGLPLPLELCYQVGLVLLMFLSGAETKGLFQRQDRRATSWLVCLGTGLPFVVALLVCRHIDLSPLAGASAAGGAGRISLILVVGIAVAVTSIPVISKIFHDMGILRTRFAKLVLGVAVLEDIVLWAILAIATTLAAQQGASQGLPAGLIARHIAVTLTFFAFGLTLAPRIMKRLRRTRWNLLARSAPAAHLLVVLFAYVAVAAFLDVNVVFAAFLAGFGVPRRDNVKDSHFQVAVESIHTLSFALFIPLYFALVGYKLNLKTISPAMLGLFLLAACSVKLASVWVGARAAGFNGLSAINLAVATNARGGPGIVLASVAYDAGIIGASFYTTLIITAIVTSQAAGAWLDLVLRRGWQLLEGPPDVPLKAPVTLPSAA